LIGPVVSAKTLSAAKAYIARLLDAGAPIELAQVNAFEDVEVRLVKPDGSPLEVTDQKGKKQKVVVYAREGYTAVKGGVGD